MRAILLALLFVFPACITAKVIDSKDRAVEIPLAQVAWQPAHSADFRGLFESTSIEGEAAASAWKLYYHFADDGTYTGAALIVSGAHPEFQTLSGNWQLGERDLDLGDGTVVHAYAAPEQLKFQSEGGTVILRHVATQ